MPVTVPEPVTLGNPGEGYDQHWTAYRWIPGHPPQPGAVTDEPPIATFTRALHAVDTAGHTWDGRCRDGPLRTRDADVRQALTAARRHTDTTRPATIWADCLTAPRHHGPDVWIHADLMPGDLLLRDGRLTAVIDFGAPSAGTRPST